jgi:hypothetical protein
MRLQLDTIIIFVHDVEKLQSFYVDILKLHIVEDAKPGWLLLEAGNCKIGLHKIGEQYLSPNKQKSDAHNNTKIVFETDNDIYAVRKELISQNVLMKEVTTFDNYDYWVCDGQDPEGNVFQLKQKK